TEVFEGWRLDAHGRYKAIMPDERGWLRCERLDLWLGAWTGWHKGVAGVFPRFYDPRGQLVFIEAEAEAQRADVEAQRAEMEKRQAEAERQRAEQAEAQLARLQAQLAKLEGRQRPN